MLASISMKILILTPWYPTKEERYGGVFVREYARAVQSRCQVTVLHCGLADQSLSSWWAITREWDKELVGDIPCYRALFRPSRVRGVSFLRRLASTNEAVSTLFRTHGRSDLIHAHLFTTGWAAILMGKWYGIPVAISEHYSGFLRSTLPYTKILQARWILGMADAVLPVSQALRRSLELHGIRATFHVVPNVVDTDLFAFQPPIPASDGTVRLLAVSSFFQHKGLSVLFRALTQVHWKGLPWRLDVVGDGPEAAQHHLLVGDLGLTTNVKFHGQMSKKDVAEMMHGADLFVQPSLFETFSVATAEALAAGLPVVVTKCGGPEEFVTERSGILVPTNDSTALADALSRMIDRLPSYDREAISREAQDRFSAARVGAMLCELYASLVEGGSRGHSLELQRQKL